MPYFFLSDLVEDPNLIQPLFKKRTKRKRTARELLKPTPQIRPKNSRPPIASQCEVYETPKDFAVYFKALYPNLKFLAHSYAKTREMAMAVLADFAEYMVGKDRQGRIRYKKYDPVTYPEVPYSMWMLNTLRYFGMSVRRTELFEKKCPFRFGVLESIEDAGAEERFAVKNSDPVVVCQFKEFQGHLRKMMMTQGSESFAKNALALFESRIKRESNVEFAKRMGVTPSATSQWAKKLKGLAVDFIDSDLCFFPNKA